MQLQPIQPHKTYIYPTPFVAKCANYKNSEILDLAWKYYRS